MIIPKAALIATQLLFDFVGGPFKSRAGFLPGMRRLEHDSAHNMHHNVTCKSVIVGAFGECGMGGMRALEILIGNRLEPVAHMCLESIACINSVS